MWYRTYTCRYFLFAKISCPSYYTASAVSSPHGPFTHSVRCTVSITNTSRRAIGLPLHTRIISITILSLKIVSSLHICDNNAIAYYTCICFKNVLPVLWPGWILSPFIKLCFSRRPTSYSPSCFSRLNWKIYMATDVQICCTKRFEYI